MAAVVGHCYGCAPVSLTDVLQCMPSCLWAAVDRLLGMHVAMCLLLTDDRIAVLCMSCNAEARLGFCSMSFLGLRLQARYTQWEYPCRDLSPPQCGCLCKDPCPGNGRCSDSNIQARGPCPPLGGWARTLLQGHCIVIIWLLL